MPGQDDKAAGGSWWERLLNRTPLLCLIAGIGFFLLAATSGFTISTVALAVHEEPWRYASAAVGLLLMSLGALLALREGRPAARAVPDAKAVDVTFGVQGRGLAVDFSGVARKVPAGIELWIIMIGSGSARRFWPRECIRPAGDGGWKASITYPALPSFPQKTFALFLVGSNGQRLIKLFYEAGHRLQEAGGTDWAGIPELTDDMVRCSEEKTVELHAINQRVA